jgi:hypothetical protein
MTPLPRYERELDERGGPKFARAVLIAFGVAAAIGLGIGLVWVATGLIRQYTP